MVITFIATISKALWFYEFLCHLVARPLNNRSVYLEAACKEVQLREEHRIPVQSLQT